MRLFSKAFMSLAAALCVLAAGAAPALAQTVTTGSINGVVSDVEGGVLPGAIVTALRDLCVERHAGCTAFSDQQICRNAGHLCAGSLTNQPDGCGGVRDVARLPALRDAGISGILLGEALLAGAIDYREAVAAAA